MQVTILNRLNVTITVPRRGRVKEHAKPRMIEPAPGCCAQPRGGVLLVAHPQGEFEIGYSRFQALVESGTIAVADIGA